MRSILVLMISSALICAAPDARADCTGANCPLEVDLGLEYVFLAGIDVSMTIGCILTAIGTFVEIDRDAKSRAWSITTIVVGLLAAIAGAATMIAVGSDEQVDKGAYVWGAVPLVVSALSTTAGIVRLSRWSSETSVKEVASPAPGVGLSFAW